MVRPGGILIIDHRNYDYILETGRAPQGKNIYYKVLKGFRRRLAREQDCSRGLGKEARPRCCSEEVKEPRVTSVVPHLGDLSGSTWARPLWAGSVSGRQEARLGRGTPW